MSPESDFEVRRVEHHTDLGVEVTAPKGSRNVHVHLGDVLGLGDHMVLVLPPLDALSLAKRLERAAGELGFAWGEVKHGV